MQYIDLSKVKGADYNPRYLSPDAKERLKKSILELGIVKPIIVRKENSTLIAGHQRTMTMKALGHKTSPAYVIEGVNKADEIRFNQMHNGFELEITEQDPSLIVTSHLKVGEFQRISSKDIEIVNKGNAAAIIRSLCILYSKYGEFGCPVCNPKGEIIISSCYAYALKMCGADMDVLCLDFDKAELAKDYLSQDYGEYSYQNIERKTWHQSFAQMRRKGVQTEDLKKRGLKSILYEKMAIPYLKTIKDKGKVRILDFGAGRYEYATSLKLQGWNIFPIDPYHTVNKTSIPDVKGNMSAFLHICKDIQANGLYDIVICDSVLNSVDTIESWESVVNTCIALCKLGGVIFMAGRSKEKQQEREKEKRISGQISATYYYDKDGFTALYRNNDWFFQKFDTEAEIKKIGESIGDYQMEYTTGACWKIKAVKSKEQSLEKAIKALRHEWDLPLPNNRSYGLSDDIETAYRNAIKKWK